MFGQVSSAPALEQLRKDCLAAADGSVAAIKFRDRQEADGRIKGVLRRRRVRPFPVNDACHVEVVVDEDVVALVVLR